MAKLVTLTDEQGNELRTKIYKHNLKINYNASEEEEYIICFSIYNSANETITINDLKKLNGTKEIGSVRNEAGNPDFFICEIEFSSNDVIVRGCSTHEDNMSTIVYIEFDYTASFEINDIIIEL